MNYPIFNVNMIGVKPNITAETVTDFLSAKYETTAVKTHNNAELLRIRNIETSSRSNKVDIFYRNESGKIKAIRHDDGLKPFLWSKRPAFGQFYSHNVIKLPSDKVNISDGYIIIDDRKIRLDDNDNVIVKIIEHAYDTEYIVRYKIESMDEWNQLIRQKMQTYGVSFTSTVSSYQHSTLTSRMLDGFCRLANISNIKNASKKSDHPYFDEEITGCYQNLLDFFSEGGVSMRGNIYLNSAKLKKFINECDSENKIKFFLRIFKWRSKFNPFSKDSLDIDGLLDLFKKYDIGGQSLTKKYIYDIIENQADKFYDFIEKYDNPKKYFNIELDNQRIQEYIIRCFTFDANPDLKELLDTFKNQKTKKDKIDKNTAGGIISDTDDSDLVDSPFLIDIFDVRTPMIYGVSPTEQYMIQTGRRLHKGIEDYEQLHVLILDIETEAQESCTHIKSAALSAKTGRIFEIGLKDNRGFCEILHADNDAEERAILLKTFKLIAEICPDILLMHNGEDFDIPFMLDRMDILGLKTKPKSGGESAINLVRDIFAEVYNKKFPNLTISPNKLFQRIENSNLKVGAENQKYTKTKIYGMSVVDTRHVMMRAKAQDSSIPNARLKDCIKHAKLAKKNRVYVKGDDIGKIANDIRPYYFNDGDGTYFVKTKNIDFIYGVDGKYNENLIKRSESGFYYDSPKNIYLYPDFGIASETDKCNNMFPIKLHAGGCILSDDDLQKSKDIIDESFDSLYNHLNEYGESIDTICIIRNGLGKKELNSAKNSQQVLQYLNQKLRQMHQDFEDVKRLYKSKDFSKYTIVSGEYIIQRYLYDDIEEPYLLDKLYSQGTFEMAKWLPTSYEKVATGGNASVWKLLLTAWSYLNILTVPDFEAGRDFNGALIGMVESGYHKKGVKKDYSSMYPSIFLTFVPTPDIDISGIYKPLVNFGLKTRLHFKNLKSQAKEQGDKAKELYYDKKQLPLKILINSFFGMLGTMVSPFSYFDAAQFITCVGRQHMRHMIEYYKPLGFKVVYFHTDGANFIIPDGAENKKYKGLGVNWNVEKDKEYSGVEAYVKEYNDKYMKGEMAVGLDGFFDVCINFAKGNFISYSLNKKGEKDIKVTGGALYRDGLNEYIEDFLNKAMDFLFNGDSVGFVKYYYAYVAKIFNQELTYRKIAKRNKIKRTIADYQNGLKSGIYKKRLVEMELSIANNLSVNVGDVLYYVNDGHEDEDDDREMGTAKHDIGTIVIPKYQKIQTKSLDLFESTDDAAFVLPFENSNQLIEYLKSIDKKQLHTLLRDYAVKGAFKPKIKGIRKITLKSLDLPESQKLFDRLLDCDEIVISEQENSKGDIVVTIMTSKHINNCIYVPEEDLDRIGKYNPSKYVDKLNKVVETLLVIFNPKVREKFITNDGIRKSNQWWTDEELNFVSGFPISADKQDNLDDLMKMADEEINFWYKMGKSPNYPFDGISIDTTKSYIVTEDNCVFFDDAQVDGTKMDARCLIEWMSKFVILNDDLPYKFHLNGTIRERVTVAD